MSLGLLNSYKIERKEKNNSNIISFAAAKAGPRVSNLPKIDHPTNTKEDPVKLPGVPRELAIKIIDAANNVGVSVGEYLSVYLKHLTTKYKGVVPEPSVTASVGSTNVTTLIDAKQIFEKTTEFIKSAKSSIQIEMFEFQNKKVDSDIWPSGGAETVPGWSNQQQILDMLVKKKQSNPEIKIQVILDAHKWYQDGFGNYKRHYSNLKMIKYLKDHNIDVVPYPRPQQGGTVLQHVKFLAVDGKKAILGGMNWGNHSSANHDACIAVETKPNLKSSEVDNFIEDLFNKDWKFAWQRLGKTKMVAGPTCPEEQGAYKGRGKEIKPEAVEYMKVVGEIFDKPEYRERYDKGNLDLVKVNPVKNPKMQMLTNSPKEYSVIGDKGSESIAEYIKNKIDNCSSLKAELFVLSHKEIVNKIIKRHQEAEKGGRPFDVQLIISPGILDDFPYCRKAYNALEESGVPIRVYKVNKDLNQRLHTKWAVFDNNELLIGSVNWSAVGLENNVQTGQRSDYPITTQLLNNRIAEYKDRIEELEKIVKLPSLYNEDKTVNYEELKERRKSIKSDLGKIDADNIDKLTTVDLAHIETFNKLLGYYNLIKIHEERKDKYKRGNHECATVVPSAKIASTFIRQFDKDWEHSLPVIPDGYGEGGLDIDDVEALSERDGYLEGRAEIMFAGKKHKQFIQAKEPTFNKVV